MSEKKNIDINDNTDVQELLKEFNENPFDPGRKVPADVMRIFYINDIPIVPVISKRNMLLGIITRKAITAEMSDIDRFSETKIDDFITKIAVKMKLDDILPYITSSSDFVVINIFGDIVGKWSRLELIAACENTVFSKKESDDEIAQNKEQQTMEWMIYLILEHIPRALYAMNENGKTIFYNSHFEDAILKKTKKTEIDIKELEKSLNESKYNDYYFKDEKKEQMYFYNKKYDFYYERVAMNGSDKLLGYLIYCTTPVKEVASEITSIVRSQSNHNKRMEEIERYLLVDSLNNCEMNLGKVVSKLGISRSSLSSKIKKYNINLEKK